MSRRQNLMLSATGKGRWQGTKQHRPAVTEDERAEWAWERWSEALRRAKEDPGDGALAAAVVSRRQELDAALKVVTPAMLARVEERQRRRKRGRSKRPNAKTADHRTNRSR